jgi:methyltransferase-like protein 6
MKVVKDQEIGVNKFWKNKYEKEAQKYWHMFYRRNKDNFYKDRHYLQAVFPELDSTCNSYQQVTLLEVGCGGLNRISFFLSFFYFLTIFHFLF